MAKRIGGSRKKSRHKFQKKKSERGKLSIRRFFQELKANDKVLLKLEPSYHKGMYHARFHGKHGIIVKKLRNCYEVKIKDGKKEKILIVHPVHLIKWEE
jgi:large subunit ribosomal protein L21e